MAERGWPHIKWIKCLINHEDLVILNLNAYNFNTYKARTETQRESAKSPEVNPLLLMTKCQADKKKKNSCKGIDNFKAQLTSLTFWTHKSFNSVIKECTIFPSTQWNTYENWLIKTDNKASLTRTKELFSHRTVLWQQLNYIQSQ